MIIIEGMDNTGKTTLGNSLAQALGIEVKHSTRPTNMEEAFSFSQELVDNINQPSVNDRCSIIGELVYGQVLRGKSLFEVHNWDWVIRLCSVNPLIIYCNPQKEVIFNWGDREQMEGVIPNKERLYTRYQFVMKHVKEIQSIMGGIFVEYDYSLNKCLVTKNGKTAEVVTYNPTDIEFLEDLYKNNQQKALNNDGINKALNYIKKEGLDNDYYY